jgi:coenzyme F420-0:L-glutamate ligase / coenzyme F420-1:gamma-L-glutamate ligase
VKSLSLSALHGIPEVHAGDSLSAIILDAAAENGCVLESGDILVVAQKIVSKAEGRCVRLDTVRPSPRAEQLAQSAQKDPRVMELLLGESEQILRVKPGVVIVEHRLGFIMANAGIDQSNMDPSDPSSTALLLPENPEASARRLRDEIMAARAVEIGVVVIDSFGRAWRNGVTGIAIGVAGVPALIDMRGKLDRNGRELRVTQIAAADELAAAASLLMGQADEGLPVVIARGFPYALRESAIQDVLRPREQDLFR